MAISNERIESIDHGQVTFRYKDYARGGQSRSLTLEADEFLRRLLLHVLPKGLVRIRACGFLANCHRAKKLALLRQLLGAGEPEVASAAQLDDELWPRCPHCGEGPLRLLGRTPRPSVRQLVASTYPPKHHDSS